MGALLGALSSLCVGGSEFFGRRSSLVTGVLAVAVVAQGVACLASLATVAVVPSAFDPGDLLLGAASGVGVGFGMVLYLGGVLRSSATVVAPLVAVLTVVIPVGYASVVDEAPSVLVGGGVVLSLDAPALYVRAREEAGSEALRKEGLVQTNGLPVRPPPLNNQFVDDDTVTDRTPEARASVLEHPSSRSPRRCPRSICAPAPPPARAQRGSS